MLISFSYGFILEGPSQTIDHGKVAYKVNMSLFVCQLRVSVNLWLRFPGTICNKTIVTIYPTDRFIRGHWHRLKR